MQMNFQNQDLGNVITHYEAEHFIENLDIIEIKEYGSKKWGKQNEILQKLNVQAHVNALMKDGEFIMDLCVTWDKVKVLIYELITSQVWKLKVLPLIKKDIVNLNSYRSYMTIYHEVVVCNILEVILYHRSAVESADEYLIEVVNYCQQKLVYLSQFPQSKKVEKLDKDELLKRTAVQDFNEQIKDLEFKLAMMSLSIIRYISDYVKYLPIGVLHYLLIECDILLVLVPLIEEKPWLRINARNEREKYENSKWTVVPKSEYNKLPKLEAQVWITIYNLFMDPECRNKYELSEQRKNNLLRLRKYMNELLLDQIPNLSLMLRSLEELAIMNTQTVPLNNPFVVEQIPKVKTALLENNKNKWAEIAKHQRENFFTQSQQSLEEDMKKLSELYGQQIVEGLMEGFKCNKCQKEASKRCSRCKSVWYCSRECQIGDWPEHKALCQVKTMELQQKQKEKEQQEKQLESNIDIKNIDKQKQPGIKELNTQNNAYENEQKQNQNTQIQKEQQQEQLEQQQGEQKQEEENQGNLDDLD